MTRSDKALKAALYKKAVEHLEKAAEWAKKKDRTWPRVHTQAALACIEAAEIL